MSEDKKDFEVKDRRMFSKDGQKAESADEATSAAPEAEEQAASSDQEARKTEAAETSPADKSDQKPPLPAINFATFVVSLNASALLHLGAIEDPTTGKTGKDLPMAKQTIDILSMLEEKTAGNLSKDEENLLKSILYDLRIIYVKEKG
ncbi:MAG: DUF1844 domain-containing protein [Desulfobacteraceae bacterium]|jgi:hypothetical protein|nr:DUF1844 domain-containing protein [Desulfobacteraceae bacterium]